MYLYYMSNCVITKYSYNKAKELNWSIKVSKNPLKKVDVYKDNIFLDSIGSSEHMDYPHYIRVYNLEYANKRKNYILSVINEMLVVSIKFIMVIVYHFLFKNVFLNY